MNPKENPEIMMPGYTDYPIAVEAGLKEAGLQTDCDPNPQDTPPSQPAIEEPGL